MRISDWSSDVCSSDLDSGEEKQRYNQHGRKYRQPTQGSGKKPADDSLITPRSAAKPYVEPSKETAEPVHEPASFALIFRKVRDRKSAVEGKSVSVRVDLGGRRMIKKKKKKNNK